MLVQVIDNETLLDKADYDNCEVWLLNRTGTGELDSRVINIAELTESTLPNAEKFPQLFTEIAARYFDNGAIPEDFSYEVITDNPDSFMIHAYVCDFNKIKVVENVGSN